MNIKKSDTRIAYLTRLAVLLAVVIIFTVFNIGNIPVGPIVATIYQVPVIIGAVLLGIPAGCILGGAWGLLCFWLAVTGQTSDIVALTVVSDNPLLYLAIAFIPRLMCGLIAGLAANGAKRILPEKLDYIGFGIVGVIGSLTNTVLYLGALYLFIKDTLAAVYEMEVGAVGAMVMGVALSNGLVEAAVSCIIVAALCKALTKVLKRL